MFFTLLAVYNISQLAKKDQRYGLFSVLACMILMRNNYSAGNSVEEYCLPFLCWSAFFLLGNIYSGSERHEYRFSIFYGITAGICFLTRITNFMPICVLLLLVLARLLYKRKYVNFVINALLIIVGAVLVTAPFVIYFRAHGCLEDMLYATFTYNVEYANAMRSWLMTPDVSTLLKACHHFFLSLILLPTAYLAGINRRYGLAVCYLLTWIVEAYFLCQGALFIQYALVCTCHIPMLFNELMLTGSDMRTGMTFRLTCYLCILFAIASVGISVWYIQKNSKVQQECDMEWAELVDEVPANDKDSLVLYGGNEFKGTYLAKDILPCYKYHAIEDWHGKFSEYIRMDIHRTYESLRAKWILTDSHNELISDILSEHYYVYDELGEYKLYCLR
jgi:hypothetical protein